MAEPITLVDAKLHLRVTSDDEDENINAAIADARGWVENYTGLKLMPDTVVETIKAFPSHLRTWPINEIISVEYVDSAGVAQTLDSAAYAALIDTRPGFLSMAALTSWPTVFRFAPVKVTMVAGYEDVADIPRNLLRAIRIMLSAYFDDRAGGDGLKEAEQRARDQCRNFKRWTV